MSPMIQIYVNLVNWGMYTIEQVPKEFREDVRAAVSSE